MSLASFLVFQVLRFVSRAYGHVFRVSCLVFVPPVSWFLSCISCPVSRVSCRVFRFFCLRSSRFVFLLLLEELTTKVHDDTEASHRIVGIRPFKDEGRVHSSCVKCLWADTSPGFEWRNADGTEQWLCVHHFEVSLLTESFRRSFVEVLSGFRK